MRKELEGGTLHGCLVDGASRFLSVPPAQLARLNEFLATRASGDMIEFADECERLLGSSSAAP